MNRGEKLDVGVANKLANRIKTSYDIPHNIQSGNNKKVAESIWRLIKNPVTEKQIMGNVYYTESSNENRFKMYRKFHNIIKQGLLNVANSKRKPLLLLDIGCGQGGDLHKWIKTKYGLVVGIDKVSENIQRAKQRWNELNTISKEKIHLYTGDFSQPLIESMTEVEREKLIALQKGDHKMDFDVISCQFAMHYFFKNTHTWMNFVRNILDRLRTNGGTLITTCMKGEFVHDSFMLQKGEISGPFGTLQQKYSATDFKENPIPLGYALSATINSIGTTNEEYLVNTEWFKKQMRFYNMNLHSPHNHPYFKKGNDTFGEIYNRVISKQNRSIAISDEEKEFSFLNQYFILKRGSSKQEFKEPLTVWNLIKHESIATLEYVTEYFTQAGYIVDDVFVQGFINVLKQQEKNKQDNEEKETEVSEQQTHVVESVQNIQPLKAMYTYKLHSLQKIASTMNIPITKQGKKKIIRRTIKELYSDIIQKQKEVSTGQVVTYTKGGSNQNATILNVHSGGVNEPPYYTIQLEGGSEIQTIAEYLKI